MHVAGRRRASRGDETAATRCHAPAVPRPRSKAVASRRATFTQPAVPIHYRPFLHGRRQGQQESGRRARGRGRVWLAIVVGSFPTRLGGWVTRGQKAGRRIYRLISIWAWPTKAREACTYMGSIRTIFHQRRAGDQRLRLHGPPCSVAPRRINAAIADAEGRRPEDPGYRARPGRVALAGLPGPPWMASMARRFPPRMYAYWTTSRRR